MKLPETRRKFCRAYLLHEYSSLTNSRLLGFILYFKQYSPERSFYNASREVRKYTNLHIVQIIEKHCFLFMYLRLFNDAVSAVNVNLVVTKLGRI
jgi:hypothetical protein